MPTKTWKIKTSDGRFLSVEGGEVKLQQSAAENMLDWLFQPAEEHGRFYIKHATTGVTLVDTVNGGYDSWSVEDCFDGTAQLVSRGGLFRHFDNLIEQSQSIKQGFAEYYNWLIE